MWYSQYGIPFKKQKKLPGRTFIGHKKQWRQKTQHKAKENLTITKVYAIQTI